MYLIYLDNTIETVFDAEYWHTNAQDVVRLWCLSRVIYASVLVCL